MHPTRQYIVVYPASSREPNNAQHISLYPNPVSDVLTVKVPSSGTIEITNYLGARVQFRTAMDGDNKIDVSSLPAGIYCVRFSDGIQQIGPKFVVCH